ncbi:MAG: peptidyl-prolyl cis-trans isomerase [Leeuwenhoekiella sp.]
MHKPVLCTILILGLFVSCDFFAPKRKGDAVARVGDKFLYQENLDFLETSGLSAEDSALVTSGYINKWATQQLMLNGAKRNITTEEQQRLNDLVDQYRTDLYAQSYKDALLSKELDSTIDMAVAEEFYEANKKNFKLNEQLFKLRYIRMGQVDYNAIEIKKRFKRFNEDDRKYLDSIAVQFPAKSLNDSIWVSQLEIIKNVPAVTTENVDKLLRKTDFLELKDSLGLYLIVVKDRLERNAEAPLSYVEQTVRQIILNKRKLSLLKQIEKDITSDAIKNKRFEIYK